MKEATAVYYRNNDKKAQVRVPALIRFIGKTACGALLN